LDVTALTFQHASESLVPSSAYGINHMTSFPHRLLEGYRNFTSQRLPTEQSRYRELSESANR